MNRHCLCALQRSLKLRGAIPNDPTTTPPAKFTPGEMTQCRTCLLHTRDTACMPLVFRPTMPGMRGSERPCAIRIERCAICRGLPNHHDAVRRRRPKSCRWPERLEPICSRRVRTVPDSLPWTCVLVGTKPILEPLWAGECSNFRLRRPK
jgi:hypothetical protein